MNLDLLAIAAHPDDVELTCGGTLLKMAQRGYKTGILDLTAGEMGTRGTPETRAKEAAKAAKLLGVKWRGTLGVPDSDVQPTRPHKLRLAALIPDGRQRFVDQLGKQIEDWRNKRRARTDGLRGREGPTAAKDSQAAEQHALLLRQEVVAPIDQRAQGCMPRHRTTSCPAQ